MLTEQEDIYYYITLLNENYKHPDMPHSRGSGQAHSVEQGILKGMYLLREGASTGSASSKKSPRVQLLGSGAILREVEAAADLLQNDFGVTADVWSATSFNELRRDGIDTERWNLLHPEEKARKSYVEQCLDDRKGPVIASTDYIRTFADQIRPYVNRRYVTLGTDGFGRSDTRRALREFFEVNRYFVAVAALKALADDGEIDRRVVSEAIKKYGIDTNKPNPVTV
jgi:pyruvate dehydrogenase E1 component